MAPLRDAGLTDRDIVDLNQVVGYYAYVNRVADGLGVTLETAPQLSQVHERPATAVRGVSEVVFWVDDLARAVAFYRDLLGFAVQRLVPEHFAFLEAGWGWTGPTLALFTPRADNASDLARAYLAEHGEPRGRLYHVAFRLDPAALDGFAQRLAQQGVGVRGPEVFADGQRSYFLEDPEGHWLELTDR